MASPPHWRACPPRPRASAADGRHALLRHQGLQIGGEILQHPRIGILVHHQAAAGVQAHQGGHPLAQATGGAYAEQLEQELAKGTPYEVAVLRAAAIAPVMGSLEAAGEFVGDRLLLKQLADSNITGLQTYLKQTNRTLLAEALGEGFSSGAQEAVSQFYNTGKFDLDGINNAIVVGSFVGPAAATISLSPNAASRVVGTMYDGTAATVQDLLNQNPNFDYSTLNRSEPIFDFGGNQLSVDQLGNVLDNNATNPNFTPAGYITTLNGLGEAGYIDVTAPEVALTVTLAPDANTLTTQLQDMGLSLQQQADVGDTKFDNAFTSTQEVKQAFTDLGYTPTDAEVGQFVGADPNVSQSISTYVDQNTVTEAEARAALQSSGIAEPTQEMLNSLVGNYNQNQLATKANEMLTGYMTAEQTNKAVRDAIAGIQFPEGLSTDDVTKAITDYMEDNPGLSATDVTNAITTELAKLPAGLSSTDVKNAIDSALTDYATKTDITNAIANIQFPAGITKEDVAAEIKAYADANPGLSTLDVTNAVAEELKNLPAYATPSDVTTALNTALADYATQANVDAATKTLQDAIDAAQAGNTTRFDEIDTAIQALRDAGLTEEQVQSVVDASADGLSTQFKDALDAAVAGNAEALGTLKTDLETKIGDVQTALETALGEQGTAFGEQVTALMEQGQSYQEAVNTALEALGTDISLLGEDVATKLADLDTTLGERIGGLESQLGDVETRLAEAIQTAKDIGLEGDQALEAAINSVAADLGTTKDALLEQIGATEETLRSDFATELGAVREELGGVESRLAEAIEAAKTAGLEGDAALDAAIQSVASDLGTTKADLLTQLGTTEQALRDDFATQLAGVTTELGNVETRLTDAIATAEAAGLSRDQAIEAALNTVAADLGTTKEDLLTQLGTVESTLRSEIEASQAALGEQVAGVETRLTEAIAAAEAAGQTRAEAIETALNQVATDLGTTKEGLLEQLGTVESGLRSEIEASQAALGEQITGVESRLTQAIADAEALGLTRDQAIQAAVDAVASDLGTTREDLLTQLGTTEATLRADLEAGLGLVSEQVADVEQRLSDAIQDAKDTGLAGDAALQAAIVSVARDLGTTREDLLSQLGTTEEVLRTDFATQLGEVTTELGNVETRLTDAIAAAEAAGLSRDQAIEAALNTVAADLGTTKEDLLGQLGTVESTLRSEIEASQAALGEQLTDVESRLKGAIADAEAAGLSRDEAIRSAVDSVASDLGTTREQLLEQIGATETTLRADLEAGLGLVGEQVAGVETRLTDAIAAAEAAGLSRDEAIQAGLDAVAADLGTTREDLLSQLGTTEEALRTEFTSGLTGLETALGEAKQAILDQMAAYEAAGIERDQALDLAITGVAQNLGTTKDDILSRLGTTEDALRTEFQAGQEALGEQLTGVEGRLTQAIAEAEAAGLSRDEAIQAAVDAVAADLGTTREGLLAQLGTTEAALRTEFQAGQEALGEQITTGIGGLQTALAEAEARINERAVQYEAAGLSRDQALQTAISDVAAQLGTTAQNLEQQLFAAQTTLGEQITGVQTGLQQQIQDVATVLGKPAQAVTQADIDLVNQMIGGQVATDLTYDANRDGVIDQNDVAFLTSITTGTEPPEFPAGTRWAPTGVYGEIAGLGRDLTRQLEEQELARQAAAEEAERAAQGRFQAQQQQQRRQQFANMLMQPGGMTPQMVQVKTPDVLKLGPQYTGIYDTAGSIFRSPEQEKLFMSPYGQFFDGGEVTEDELLEIVRG